MSLAESPMTIGETDGTASVLRLGTLAICTVGSEISNGFVCHRGQLDIYGGSFCSLADWCAKSCSNDACDSIDAQHGAATLRCVRSEVLSGAEVSEMQLTTVWLLNAKGMHTFRASIQHELEVEDAKKKKVLGRVTRFFREAKPKATSLSVSNSVSMYVTCDLEFADFLNKLGVMRRVRDGALSSNNNRSLFSG